MVYFSFWCKWIAEPILHSILVRTFIDTQIKLADGIERRRPVLKALGSTIGLSAIGVSSASSNDVKVIKEVRPFDNPLKNGHIVREQKRELSDFPHKNTPLIGGVDNRTKDCEIVGFVAAVNRNGKTRRFIGSSESGNSVDKIHSEVEKYAEKFEEDL